MKIEICKLADIAVSLFVLYLLTIDSNAALLLSTFVLTQSSTRSVKESRPEPSIVKILDCYNRGLLQSSGFEIYKLEDIAVSLSPSRRCFQQ